MRVKLKKEETEIIARFPEKVGGDGKWKDLPWLCTRNTSSL